MSAAVELSRTSCPHQSSHARDQQTAHDPGVEAAEAGASKVGKETAARKPRRIIPTTPRSPGGGSSSAGEGPKEVLIVASRLKDYVRAVSGYNTSDGVLGPLSEIVRAEVAKAIEKARADGRKTVLERDVSS